MRTPVPPAPPPKSSPPPPQGPALLLKETEVGERICVPRRRQQRWVCSVTLVRSRWVIRLVYSGTQQDLKFIHCKLDWRSWHTSDRSGRSTAPRELDESHQEHLHTSPQSLHRAHGVFWVTTEPQMHALHARLEKLTHVRSFGTFNSSARARRVASKKKKRKKGIM